MTPNLHCRDEKDRCQQWDEQCGRRNAKELTANPSGPFETKQPTTELTPENEPSVIGGRLEIQDRRLRWCVQQERGH